MRVTTIKLSATRTLNMGNFNSMKVEAEITAELGDGETVDDVRQPMQAEVNKLLKANAQETKGANLI
jgi:hypothetical protein